MKDMKIMKRKPTGRRSGIRHWAVALSNEAGGLHMRKARLGPVVMSFMLFMVNNLG
jgi:hypothetical protein